MLKSYMCFLNFNKISASKSGGSSLPLSNVQLTFKYSNLGSVGAA